MNDEQIDAALDFLKDAVRQHLNAKGNVPGLPQSFQGMRRGAFAVLNLLGFGDAALDAVRQVYEDEGRRHQPIEEVSYGPSE